MILIKGDYEHFVSPFNRLSKLMKKKTEQKVINFIDTHGLIDEGDRILIALSGGPDSVFALHFFHKYKRRFKIEIDAVHLNHKLRGKESDKDEKFCEQLCEKMGIELITSQVDIIKLKEKSRKSIEEIAREQRYKFFDYTASKLHSSKIITAHVQNDNTETVLLNLSKGTGIKGISGIPVKRGKIIRPLLILSKEEVLAYLNETKLKYRIDKSNEENDYQRNIIRNKILPVIISGINPCIHDAVFRTSQNLRVLSAYINKQVEEYFNKYVETEDNSIKISNSLYEKVESSFLDEVLKLTLEKFLQSDVSAKDVAKLKGLYYLQVGKDVKFKENHSALRERNFILLKRTKKTNFTEAKIKVGHSIKIADHKISIWKVKNSRFLIHEPGCEFISMNVENPTFTIRNWKDGDKFIPLGMKNFKKVSDFLTDKKIPSSQRKKQLVLTYRNQIVWLVGLRIDERYKITTSTKQAIKLCLS